MAMTDKERFRFRCLEKCAAAGLTPEQIRTATTYLRKQALDMGWMGTVLKAPLNLGALKILAGTTAGVAGGYGLAKLTEENVDPEMAKQYELIAAYRQQAERARRQAARADYRPAKTTPRMTQLT